MSLERNFNHSNYMTLKGLLVLSPKPVFQQLDGEVSFYGAVMAGYVYECSQHVDSTDPTAEFGTALPPNVAIVSVASPSVLCLRRQICLCQVRADGQKASAEELKCIFRAASRGGKLEEKLEARVELRASPAQPFVSRKLGCFTAYRVLGEEYSPSGVPNCLSGLSPTKMYSMYDPYRTTTTERPPPDLSKSVIRETAEQCMDYTYRQIQSTLPEMLSQIETEGPHEALLKLMQDRTDAEQAYNNKYGDADFDEEMPPMPPVGPG
eukprot:GHVS01021281.1.p1 GENE.GHVS01021281.1~~GHVS01021281.1.p1  ORF type:complete len:265 (-),score=54.21 GHVS01021281.1:23-817(-)